MKTFDDSSSSATNVSDKLIELQEGKKGNIVRVVRNGWEEIQEIWITVGEKTRRFRCNEQVQKLIDQSGQNVPVRKL